MALQLAQIPELMGAAILNLVSSRTMAVAAVGLAGLGVAVAAARGMGLPEDLVEA
jgi:hypothetical protein